MSQPPDKWDDAAHWFLRMRSESGCAEDLTGLQRWLEADPQNALAYRRVTAAWKAIDEIASHPAVVSDRRDALAHFGRSIRSGTVSLPMRIFGSVPRRPWVLACVVLLVLTSGWWLADGLKSHDYSTDVGERRTVMLPDGSSMTLDARSRVRVYYTSRERWIRLERGQARFAVAQDSMRPFRVVALNRAVIALGTVFNVELVSNTLNVALLEGRVTVVGASEAARVEEPGPTARSVELTAGEGLHIRQDGAVTLVPVIDVERVSAWQTGKLFFEGEPLASAAERVNRYSRRPVTVDPAISDLSISGVFNSGDVNAFVEAVTGYFPVQVDTTDASRIHLIPRP